MLDPQLSAGANRDKFFALAPKPKQIGDAVDKKDNIESQDTSQTTALIWQGEGKDVGISPAQAVDRASLSTANISVTDAPKRPHNRRTSALIEKYETAYRESKSHNLMISLMNKAVAGALQMALSFSLDDPSEIKEIQENVKTKATSEVDSKLRSEYAQAKAMMDIVGGGSKKQAKRQMAVLNEIRKQLTLQAKAWGKEYTPLDFEEMELDAARKIKGDFLAEKSNLEYEMSLLGTNKQESLIKIQKLEVYISRVDTVVSQHARSIAKMIEAPIGDKKLVAKAVSKIGNRPSVSNLVV